MIRPIADIEPLGKQRRRIGRLKTPKDVARYIARCIRRADKGEGEENRAYKLVMMASILLKALEVADIERRIARLEEHLPRPAR